MWEEMHCKSSDCGPKGIVLLHDCTFPRHKKIQLAMIYVSMDQQVIVVPNLQHDQQVNQISM
jgi:hypothetical protein